MFISPVPQWQCWSVQVAALLAGHGLEVCGRIPCGVYHPLASGTMSLGTDPPLSLEGRSWLNGQTEENYHSDSKL